LPVRIGAEYRNPRQVTIGNMFNESKTRRTVKQRLFGGSPLHQYGVGRYQYDII